VVISEVHMDATATSNSVGWMKLGILAFIILIIISIIVGIWWYYCRYNDLSHDTPKIGPKRPLDSCPKVDHNASTSLPKLTGDG
jgi:hypothetical protein